MILGVDPGSEKCGLAVVADLNQAPLAQCIAPRGELQRLAQTYCRQFAVTVIALGSGTQMQAARADLHSLDLPIVIVDEYGTTLGARGRYYAAHPPQGWRRLIPRGLLVPTVPIDDWAAVLIAERYLQGEGKP